MPQGSVRLNKFVSESGLCSRREADRFIEQGHVFINGRKAVIGDQVKVGDRVQVNGIELEPRRGEDIIFIALNKPVGITSTTEKGVSGNIVQFVNHSKRIFPIGRLDKNSQGLIFLTNNGDIVNKILRAGNQHEKEYVVAVNKPLTEGMLKGMANGVPMLGVKTKKCKIIKQGPCTFRIILTQGLNRQIRRMCAYFGYEVTKLERVRIMNIDLTGLPTGDWRYLTKSEMDTIYKMLENSSSEVIKNPSILSVNKFPDGKNEKRLSKKSSGSWDSSTTKRNEKSKVSHKSSGKSRNDQKRNAGSKNSRKSRGGKN